MDVLLSIIVIEWNNLINLVPLRFLLKKLENSRCSGSHAVYVSFSLSEVQPMQFSMTMKAKSLVVQLLPVRAITGKAIQRLQCNWKLLTIQQCIAICQHLDWVWKRNRGKKCLLTKMSCKTLPVYLLGFYQLASVKVDKHLTSLYHWS